jgi:peptide/nickel transport system substrate-binding protein
MPTLKQLENGLMHGMITRRQFMKMASAMGLTAAVSPILLTTSAQADTPKKGGRFRIGHSDYSTTDSLNPELGSSTGVVCLYYQFCNSFIEEGPNGSLVPELAQSWESSTDVKKWVFKLRKGVEFHNGKIFDAQDAIYSINLHRGDKSKSPAKPLLSAIKDIRADDKHTLIFTLDQGNVDFPAILSYFNLCIVPSGTTDFEKGIGTGPYVLKAIEPGVKTFATRNPNYWKSDRAHFDEVELISISDVNARINALRAGQIDAMDRCDLKTIDHLRKVPDVQIVRTTGRQHYVFPMRTDTAPYDNGDVSLALKYAIDRESILKKILNGYGTLGNDHPISPAHRFLSTELPQRQYDPDKARYHLKKSGIGNFTFKLHTSPNVPFQGAQDTAVLYQHHATKAGITIEVVAGPADGYWSDVWMNKPWCSSFWTGQSSENMMFTVAYAGGAPWNETYWQNDRFDSLLKATRTELDEENRREMYGEMQKIVRDEGGAVIPVFADYVDAANTRLKFGELSSAWQLDGARAPERWWFDS